MDYNNVKRRSTAQLLKNLETKTGEELEMVKEILAGRGKMPAEEVVEESLDPVADARKNIGRECSFIKDKTEIRGTIRGVMHDKRVDFVYYRIISLDGLLYHKKVNSEKLSIYG